MEASGLKRRHSEMDANDIATNSEKAVCQSPPSVKIKDNIDYLTTLPALIFERIFFFLPSSAMKNFMWTSKANHNHVQKAFLPFARELGFSYDNTLEETELAQAQKFVSEFKAELLGLAELTTKTNLPSSVATVIRRYAIWESEETLDFRRTALNLRNLPAADVFKLFSLGSKIYSCPKILTYFLKHKQQFNRTPPSTAAHVQPAPAVRWNGVNPQNSQIALKSAIAEKNTDVCHFLLDLGANSKDVEVSLLMLAIEKNDERLFKRTALCFKTLSFEDKQSILLAVFASGNLDFFKDIKAQFNHLELEPFIKRAECFFAAASGGNIELFEITMNALGVGVDETFPSGNSLTPPNKTALHLAMEAGRLDLMQWLLRKGAKLDFVSLSLLETTLEKGHTGITKFLLERKTAFKLSIKPNELLYKALLHPSNAANGVLDLLKEMKANVNYSNTAKKIESPLFFVMRQRSLTSNDKAILVEKLVALGANPFKCQAKSQAFPLIEAISASEIEVVKKMLKAPLPENYEAPLKIIILYLMSWTPAVIAAEAGVVLRALFSYERKELADATTALAHFLNHRGAWHRKNPRKMQFVRELVKLGASPYAKCIDGDGTTITAFQVAMKDHDWNLANFFLEEEPSTLEEKEHLALLLQELLADRRELNNNGEFIKSPNIDAEKAQIAIRLLDLGAEPPLAENLLIYAAASTDLLEKLLANQKVTDFIRQRDAASKLVLRMARKCLGIYDSLALLWKTFESLQTDPYLFSEAALNARHISNLTKVGFDPNQQDPLIGQTLLTYAYCKSLFANDAFIKLMETLAFKRNADLEKLDRKGQALIHYVVQKDSSQPILRALLAISAAFIDLPNQAGKTPFEIAVESGSKETVKYLQALIKRNPKRGPLPQIEGEPASKRQKISDPHLESSLRASSTSSAEALAVPPAMTAHIAARIKAISGMYQRNYQEQILQVYGLNVNDPADALKFDRIAIEFYNELCRLAAKGIISFPFQPQALELGQVCKILSNPEVYKIKQYIFFLSILNSAVNNPAKTKPTELNNELREQIDTAAQLLIEESFISKVYKIKTELLIFLLQHGANPFIKRTAENTPLYFYAVGNTEMLKQFFETHAIDPNYKNDENASILSYAALEGNLSSYNFLRSRINSLDSNILHYAVLGTNTAIVESVLAEGADPNHVSGEKSPLQIAIANNNISIVNTLLAHGADRYQTTKKFPLYPVYFAAVRGNLELVKSLAESTTVNHLMNGKTLVTAAACNGHFAIVEYLLSIGADPWIPSTFKSTNEPVTALHGAIAHGQAEYVAQWLKEKPEEINNLQQKSFYHKNCNFSFLPETHSVILGLLVTGNGRQVFSILLEYGFDPLLKEAGKSYLYWAYATKSLDAANEMIAKHPDSVQEVLYELLADGNLELLADEQLKSINPNHEHPIYGHPLELALKVKDVKKRAHYVERLLQLGAKIPDKLIYALVEDPETCALAEPTGIFAKLQNNYLLHNLLVAKCIEVINSNEPDKEKGMLLLKKAHEGGYNFYTGIDGDLLPVADQVRDAFEHSRAAKEIFYQLPDCTRGQRIVV